jgi:Skp family chaperone for outer membrane proteins
MKLTSALLVAMVLIGTMPQANATPLAAKVGYFNLKLIESKDPDMVNSNPATAEAAQKLQAELDDGNKALRQMQERHESKESMESYAKVLQTKINEDQKRLMAAVQALPATEKIKKAIRTVAASRGLDLTVDAGLVFFGGSIIVQRGTDLTDDICASMTGKSLSTAKSVDPAQLNLGYFDASLIRSKVPALMQMDANTSYRKMAEKVLEVAKSRGIDFVIEAAGVYDGGSLVITKGVDITNDLINLLSKDSK